MNDPGNRQALRDAITNQLAVLRSMRRDAELAGDDREEVFELLRSVWAHLRRLHDDATTGDGDASGAVEALKVLGKEVEGRLRVWGEEATEPNDEPAPRRLGEEDPGPDDGGDATVPPVTVGPRVSPPFSVPHTQGSSPLGP